MTGLIPAVDVLSHIVIVLDARRAAGHDAFAINN
jgi:hypothetical protein